MAKYHKLVRAYAEEIEGIRQMYEELDAISKQIHELMERICSYEGGSSEDLGAASKLASEYYPLYIEYSDALGKLHADVGCEYADAPFAKAREQGIKRFWELAGIAGL